MIAVCVWSKAEDSPKFLGSVCKDRKLPGLRDRSRNQECSDVNAGEFFLSVINQVGVNKQPLIMDVKANRDVWNHPVTGYRFSFFNPRDEFSSKTWRPSTVPKDGFSRDDSWRVFRSPKTAFITGVEMTLTYIKERSPRTIETDNPSLDAIEEVTYTFDLELDEDLHVIGGEWHEKNHPDFLWIPSGHSLATSNDIANIRWRSGEPMPEEMMRSPTMPGPDPRILGLLLRAASQRD